MLHRLKEKERCVHRYIRREKRERGGNEALGGQRAKGKREEEKRRGGGGGGSRGQDNNNDADDTHDIDPLHAAFEIIITATVLRGVS